MSVGVLITDKYYKNSAGIQYFILFNVSNKSFYMLGAQPGGIAL